MFSEDLQQKVSELEAQRNSIRNRIRRASPDEIPGLKEQAKEITKQITPLRTQLKSVRRIEERSQAIPVLLEQERQMENDVLRRNQNRRYER